MQNAPKQSQKNQRPSRLHSSSYSRPRGSWQPRMTNKLLEGLMWRNIRYSRFKWSEMCHLCGQRVCHLSQFTKFTRVVKFTYDKNLFMIKTLWELMDLNGLLSVVGRTFIARTIGYYYLLSHKWIGIEKCCRQSKGKGFPVPAWQSISSGRACAEVCAVVW